MPGLATASSPIKRMLVCILLIVVVASPVGNAYVMASCENGSCGKIAVSPGKYAKELGVDFPTFGIVKLSYPNSTILTNSIGDLLFSVNLTRAGHYDSIEVYIPSDFTGLTTSKVWTSFTNDYNPNSLSVSGGQLSVKNLTVTRHYANAANRTFIANETQYIRIFQITSPSIAGRYFFKTFINGTAYAKEFPTVVVKASRDPAYISGVLRDAGNTGTSLAGKPIDLANGYGARVLATGRDYLGRSVAAQAFLNSTAQGNYTLFGVAPGTYNLTAYAAGFIPTTSPIPVSVLAGQSLEGVDIYLKHSVNVTGTVLSIGTNGLTIPWNIANRSAVTIEVLTLSGAVVASTRAYSIDPTDPTSFHFSIQREVGLDERIPQAFANYTSGLAAGDYLLRASVPSYIQLEDTRVHVSNDTTLVRSFIQLFRTGSFIVIVHFKAFSSTLNETKVPESGTLTVEAYDQQGNVGGSGTARVPANSYNANVTFPCPPGTYHVFARFTTFQGSELFYQTEDVQGTIGLGNTTLSLAMVRGGGLNLTLFSVDAEKPWVPLPWAFPNATINLKIIDSKGNVYSASAVQQTGSAQLRIFYAGLLTDDYSIIAQTFGYSQRQITSIRVVLGGNSDASVWMVQDPRVDLTVLFKTEGVLSPINSNQSFAEPIRNVNSTPVRVEIFDEYGNFAGANRTYVGNGNYSVEIGLAGFNEYFGNPRLTWSGFYDTTDATRQDEGGLPPGDYMIRIWVDGYYQPQIIYITLPPRGNVSIVTSMERASRVSGMVLGPDLYDEAVLLSWAVVDLEPGGFTTFSLDGNYSLWVPSGSYNIGVSLPGYSTYTARFEVFPGSDIHADFWLDDPQLHPNFFTPSLPPTGIGLAVKVSTWFVSVRQGRCCC
jgi:hypothetical protein